MLPEALWTRRFIVAWLGCFVTVLAFDVLWSIQTLMWGMLHVGTYVNAMLLATVLALPAVCSRRQWPQLVVLLLADAALIANLMYCRTFFDAIPPQGYGHIAAQLDFTSVMFDTFSWLYLVLPVIAVVTFLLMNPGEDSDEPRPNAVFYLCTLGMLALVSAVIAMFSGGMSHHIAQIRRGFASSAVPVIYTVPGTLVADATAVQPDITGEQRDFVARWGREHVGFRNAMGEPADTLVRRDNLVVVLWNSLESWPIGIKVEGKELTPNLNRALLDSTLTTFYAPRVLAQTGVGRSIDGQLLMLAGMYPMADGSFSVRHADNHFHTLPDAMKRNGAKTYLLSGSEPWMWNVARVAKSFGIDHLVMRDSWNNSETIGGKILSDNSFISQSVARMQRGEVWPEGESAYVQLMTHSTRAPFKIPEELQTIALSEGYPPRLLDYMTAVHYTDQAVGRLLDYLRQRSDWDRTMVVIVGDRGALSLWRSALRSDAAGAKLVSSEEYVPLLIINAPVGGYRKAVMGQVDVYPTLLDQMGLDADWRGMGFTALGQQSPAFAVTSGGRIVGNTSGTPAGLPAHIDGAREASDLTLRYDLLEE